MAPAQFVLLSMDIVIAFSFLLGQKKLQNDIPVQGILIQAQGSSWKCIKEENGSEPRAKLLPSAQFSCPAF